MHGHAFPVRPGMPPRGGAKSDTEDMSEVEVEEEIEVEEGASYCRATFSFTAQDAREMSIAEHDIIEIVEKSEGGWWTGKLGTHQVAHHIASLLFCRCYQLVLIVYVFHD
jgi:hypothetical protein